MKITFLYSLLLLVLTGCQANHPLPDFQHPGILHSQSDLDRIRQMVAAGTQPWKDGFAVFAAHPQSQSNYKMLGPVEIVNRPGPGNAEMWQDANAAYQNALMYCITGEESHAKKAVEILNAWSYKLKSIVGHDAQLAAGLYGFKFVSAAELMRYEYNGWQPKDIAQAETMFKTAIYPTIQNFATFANGNWDGACMKTMMAIGIFCNDRPMFDRAVDYYLHGTGDGAITHYIIDDSGQCQESGRDQAHTQLGIGLLAECCEIAWKQNIDLYSAADNRLMKGYEYTAKYNLGLDVPFVTHVDTTGKYRQTAISSIQRGRLRAVWEIAWNHYHGRLGLEMPFTSQVVAKLYPEGNSFQADNVGFGTLLFRLPSSARQ
jgi:hypothetical protein